MQKKLLYAVGFLALWSGPVLADEAYDKCLNDPNGNNGIWSECGAILLKQEEARMAEAWKKAFALATLDSEKKLLLAEQRAWIAFKDKSCNLHLEDHGTQGIAVDFPMCRAEVLVARRKQLEGIAVYLKGPEGQ